MENWKIQFTAKATLPDDVDKPNQGEMVKFLFETLGRKHEEIKSMYLAVSGKSIYFRCYNEDTMRVLVENYDGAQFKFDNGSVARVQMTQESEVEKYVRVWGLPPDAPDADVARFFGHYGVVKRIVRERYPRELNCPIETGVRGIYMELRQEMPHFMFIRNFRIKIHYDGMKERCFGCGSTDHIKSRCPKNFTPASRVATMESMVNLNNLFGKGRNAAAVDPSAAAAAPTVTTAAPTVNVVTPAVFVVPERPVTPAISYADMVAASPQAVSAKQPIVITSDDEARKTPPAPTTKTPVTRKQRSRVRTPASASDRSRRSDSSTSSSRGRPKKSKSLALETIAKGHSSMDTSNSGFVSATEESLHDEHMQTDGTSNEKQSTDDEMNIGDQPISQHTH